MYGYGDKIGCLFGTAARVGDSLTGGVSRVGDSIRGIVSLVCAVGEDLFEVFECADGVFILSDDSEFLVVK